MREVALLKPLPPQKWGFWATNEFWVLASLTPITLIFWATVPFFFALVEYLGSTWWQSALAFWVFFGVWGGLIERWSRQYLRRRRPALGLAEAYERPAALEAPDHSGEAQLVASAVPPAALAPEPTRVPTTEDWNAFYRRVFGRLAGVASVASDIGFFLLFFYPGWVSKLVAVLLMTASFFVVRGCTRRWRAASLPPGRQSPRPTADSPERNIDSGMRMSGGREVIAYRGGEQ